jgi:hypothetical protein
MIQEMCNPLIRQHLQFLPEDSCGRISEAWQADRWLKEIDPNHASPMVRIKNQDYYVYEPSLLADGRACMPIRWFRRGNRTLARAWLMHSTPQNQDWLVCEDNEVEVDASDFTLSLPEFAKVYPHYCMPDPHIIRGK